MLSLPSCRADPEGALVRGVLEPLRSLPLLAHTRCLLVVDALDEAELHRPDYGHTIASLLASHAHRFPAWLKVLPLLPPGWSSLCGVFGNEAPHNSEQ